MTFLYPTGGEITLPPLSDNMPNSYAKRRAQQKPIRLLKQRITADLDETLVREAHQLSDRHRTTLISEITAMASPYLCPDRDALLPAHRPDLRRDFVRRIFAGEGTTRLERLRLAREMAPAPDSHCGRLRTLIGSPTPLSYGEVQAAFKSQRRRHNQKGESPSV